ncbi:MAG: 4Fe-4S binding protein [Candidatus Kariarchaeaceae archaeon]
METTQISITPEKSKSLLRQFLRWIHFRAFRTTLRTMFRVPITDLYHPVHRKHNFYPSVPLRYRGMLALSEEACTGCKKCERACPTNCIIMELRLVDGKEFRFPGYFSGRCMMCGLCEESCDRQFAIRHTDQFEDAGYTRDQIYYGPERMFDMWDKHVEPKIQAGIEPKAVPDKKRWEEENMHQWPINRPEGSKPQVLTKADRKRLAKEEADKQAKKRARAAAQAKKKPAKKTEEK